MSAVSCGARARRCLPILMICSLAAAGQALAALSGPPATPAKPRATSVRFIDAPSGENPAARERRLRRECRGRPNAGACLGLTR
jgi:hypothetical protein